MKKIFWKKTWRKLKAVAKLKGSPYSIAMGGAIGVFWNFIPSLGVGPFLSVGLARVVKASGVAALATNLSTGFFIPLFYSLNFLMGRFLLQRDVSPQEVGDTVQESFKQTLDVVEEPLRYFYLQKIQSFSTNFFAGGLVNALLAAGLVYLVLWTLLSYRRYLKAAGRQYPG